MDYLLGGLAATCAGFFSNPFDVIKTRKQLQGELQKSVGGNRVYGSLFSSIKVIVKSEGITGLQKGLSPALSFQFVMNSIRLGTFQTVSNLGWTKFDQSATYQSPILCIFWGGFSGVIGAAVGCPFYMIKTQMQAQSFGTNAVGYQHSHKGLYDALRTTMAKSGIKGLYRGISGLVPRTAVGSSVQLPTFTLTKDLLVHFDKFEDSVFLTALVSAMVSGLFTVVAMTPFDVVSTRLFNQGVDANGKGLLYKNLVDCFAKTFKVEGTAGLYKGFVANYWRASPHTILNLTFWEQFKKWKHLYDENNKIVL